MENKSNIIIYKSNDGKISIDCIFNNKSVWLSQNQIANLYGRSTSTINEHIKNIFNEKELTLEQVSTKFGNSKFSTKPTTWIYVKFLDTFFFEFLIFIPALLEEFV